MKNKKNVILVIIAILIIIIIAYMVNNMVKEKNREYEINDIKQYNYFVLKENDKYGVIDNKGNKIIETKYTNVKIPNPSIPVFVCYEEESTIVLNEKAQEIFEQYDNVQPLRLKNVLEDLVYEKSVLKYSKDGKYGIIDLTGKKLTNPIYEEIDTLQFKEGELLVKLNGKYGVINIKGARLVKTNYDKIEADKFYEEGSKYKNAGYIVSKTTEQGYRYGYVNLDGKEIIETKYNDLYRITDINSEDIYIINAENGKYGLSKNGKQLINNEYQSLIYNESANVIIGLKGKKYGVLSIDGEIIIPFEYKEISVSGKNIYCKTNDEKVKVFDDKGKETNIDENLSIIEIESTGYKINIETINNKTSYNIYKDNKNITKNEYIYIEYLYDNYFIACNTNGKLGIIDDNEKTKIEFNYNSISKLDNKDIIQTVNNDTKVTELYSKNLKKICELENATIQDNNEYVKIYNEKETKYVTKDGKETKNTEIFESNEIFAHNSGNKWGFIDKLGNKIIDYKFDKVTEVNEFGFAGIKLDDKWGVIDSKGNIVVNPIYELDENLPSFIGSYYQVVYGNGEIYYTK